MTKQERRQKATLRRLRQKLSDPGTSEEERKKAIAEMEEMTDVLFERLATHIEKELAREQARVRVLKEPRIPRTP